MIDEVRFVNQDNNLSITAAKRPGIPVIIDKIDWGSATAQHNQYNNLTGYGDKIISTKVKDRSVSITGKVCCIYSKKQLAQMYGISTLDEISQKKLELIAETKEQLSKLFNPISYVRIEYNNFYISGKPNTSVKFANTEKENNEVFCKFTVTLTCDDPMFHTKSNRKTILSGVRGGFHFPLVIPINTGMHFGVKVSYQLIVVTNNSDTPIGGKIYLKATGTVENPEIVNVYTQERMCIKKTLSAGETVVIDTENRTVTGYTSNSDEESYLQYWDFDNTWFQFVVGNTLFGYSADDETYKSLDVYVEYNESFYSVGDE